MKHLLSLLCLCALSGAWAQLPATYDPVFDAHERERIAAEREQVRRHYAGEEADCYQRFAVNDCLRGVRKRHRQELEGLRRQEIVLNDARRAATAVAQQRKVEERQAERDAPAAQAQRAESEKTQESREQDAQRRQAEHAATLEAVPAPAAQASAPQSSAAARDAAEHRAEMQKAYDLRQKEAEERRQKHEQQLKEQGTSQVKPLPVPP